MKALIAKLNETERNLERAIDALNDAFRCGAPAKVTNGLQAGITSARRLRDEAREQLDLAIMAESGVEEAVIAEPLPQVVVISREELDNLVWLAENDMRQVEERYPYQSGAALTERAARKELLLKSAATLREMRVA